MGGNKSLREQQRQRKPGPQGAQPSSARSTKRPPFTSGPLGKNDAAERLAQRKGLPPLEIHLNLTELIELNNIIDLRGTGAIAKGDAFAKDQKRPQKVLAIVISLFSLLGKRVRIRLGTGANSSRYLMAAFAWGVDPDIGGVSAKGYTRSKMGHFNRMGNDQGKPVTGYIFEGVIGNWLIIYLGGKATNIDNLFATIITHELGHQLGLDHSKSPNDIMFGFGDGSRNNRIKWLQLAQMKALKFSDPEIETMKNLLNKP
jgi:hypothetical protein